MSASRYQDWESFRFPGGLAGSNSGSSGLGSADQHGADQHGADQHGADQHGADQYGPPVAFCSDLSAASVLGAYRRGIVPIPAASEYFRTLNEVKYEDQVAAGAIAVVGGERDDPYWAAWWSPDPRLPSTGTGFTWAGTSGSGCAGTGS